MITFDAFCLGGPIEPLLKWDGLLKTQVSGIERKSFFRDDVAIVSVDGTISSVTKLFRPGTWGTYLDIFHEFQRRYGDGEGRSEYPRWADDTESRELAIKTGDGYTLHRWETREISVVLFWSGPGDSMSVSYFHAALDERVRSAKSPMTRQR